VPHSTLHGWYKNHLSGFTTKEAQQELHRYDIKPPPGSNKATIAVPILKREHIGPSMAIDEKHIDGKFYTILSNNETGKVALMAATHKKKELDKAMMYFGDKCSEVRILTRDLSITYDWLGRDHFFRAGHVADKFHILRYLFDALHDVRIYHRQLLLTKKRLAQQQKRDGITTETPIKETALENGDTHAELLARSIHLLYKREEEWNPSQAARAKVLFKHYPDIKKAYRLTVKFRDWYDVTNVGKDIEYIKDQLQEWLDEVALTNIPEMLNFKALVERHSGIICNYFLTGQTNAKAEAINKKIQSIISNYVNTRNINFAHFRLANILS
jgi:transposase